MCWCAYLAWNGVILVFVYQFDNHRGVYLGADAYLEQSTRTVRRYRCSGLLNSIGANSITNSGKALANVGVYQTELLRV